MYTSTEGKPWTVPMLADAKRDGRKLVMLTAYDAGFARVLDESGTDLILVGDSLGMVVQGHDSTLPVTVDDCVYHVRCVARGLRKALLIADLPFGADATPERAFRRRIRAERHVGDQQRLAQAARDAAHVVDDVVDRHRQRAVVALHHHAERIADEQGVHPAVVEQPGEGGVVGGQHGDRLARGVHRLQAVQRDRLARRGGR